ncbi:copper homeostasis periplasmic binding protein CopC [Kushneria sp. Sum13]|uniref:copper homeostasis periplasmic binding protein CopC n=1 Tax=Kushneria sp. Sum13 TaxID=3459196 RepID=UPI0040454D66
MNALKRWMAPLFLIALSVSTQALAHAHLKAATPGDKASVSTLHEISLTFSEALELPFSGVDVVGTDGNAVTLDEARLQDGGRTLVTPIGDALESGRYDVHWHVLSVDGHKTQGQYSFDVTP